MPEMNTNSQVAKFNLCSISEAKAPISVSTKSRSVIA